MLIQFASFGFLVPCIIGIICYKKIPSILKLLLIVFCVIGIVDGFTHLMLKQGHNTSLVLNLFIIPYMILWTIPIYIETVKRTFRKVILLLGGLASIGVITILWEHDLVATFSRNAVSIAGMFLVAVNLIYFSFVGLYSDKISLREHPLFTIQAVFLVYQAFNTVIFVFSQQLPNDVLLYLDDFRHLSYVVLIAVISFTTAYYARYVEQ